MVLRRHLALSRQQNVGKEVKDIISKLLEEIVKGDERTEEDKVADKERKVPTSKRKGQPKQRSRPLNCQQLRMLKQVLHPDEVAEKYKTNRTNIINWIQKKSELMEATKSEMKDHLKIRRSKKYLELYRALEIKFKECRAKRYRISFALLWSHASRIYRDQTGDESAHVGHHVIDNFIKQYNLWHTMLRERLVRADKDDDCDAKLGRFLPQCRLNVDQSPSPFVFDSGRTYHQLSQAGAEMDKRQCSLQICFCPEGQLPRLGTVFRGTGKKISEDEPSSWHEC